MVVTKNQPKPACFKAAKATFLLFCDTGIVVEELGDSKVANCESDESKLADNPERCKFGNLAEWNRTSDRKVISALARVCHFERM